MSKFDEKNSHEDLIQFFNLLEMLYTNDFPINRNIDSRLKTLTNVEKTDVEKFFELIIDQPSFLTRDHQRIRSLLVDWYASNRSLVTRVKTSNNILSLPNDTIDELIKCFGFPYPENIISINNKPLFLLDLVNLYNKKGTPSALLKSLQYFGVTNVTLSEWWIHRTETGLYVARSQPILPRSIRNSGLGVKELTYNDFTSTDPLWQLSESQLDTYYNSSEIKLPSITPHFSIDSVVPIDQLYPIVSIISKVMKESYDYWSAHGTLNRDIALLPTNTDVSFLELCLAIGYVFDNELFSSDKHVVQYMDRIDADGNNIYTRQAPDKVYADIMTEYSDYQRRIVEADVPTDSNLLKDFRETHYNDYKDAFTKSIDDYFLRKVYDGNDPNFAAPEPHPVEAVLRLINPAFINAIDEELAVSDDNNLLLEQLFLSLDGYIQTRWEVSDFSLSYFVAGSAMFTRLKPVINFFKPHRARIRDLLTSFLINKPLEDSQYEKDYLFTTVTNEYHDYGAYIPDDAQCIDELVTTIHQTNESKTFDYLDSNFSDAINIELVESSGATIMMVSSGRYHTMVLTESGDVYGWGRNDYRQVNPASATNPWITVPTIIKSGVKYIDCGWYNTMCILDNGDLVGWGLNQKREVNPASGTSPWTNTSTVFKSGVSKVSGGQYHTMCVLDNGDVVGWGENTNKQVNPASGTDPWIDPATVIRSGVSDISCGTDHTMCILDNGDVVGWGDNVYRQVNPGSADFTWTDPDTVIRSGVSKISTGDEFTLCILDNGDVVGWGLNNVRQVNPGSATSPWINRYTVIRSGVSDISCGKSSTMCILDNGDLVGWGLNSKGQVNPASGTSPWTNTSTVLESNVYGLDHGYHFAMCVFNNGNVVGSGENFYSNVNPADDTSPWLDRSIVFTNLIP